MGKLTGRKKKLIINEAIRSSGDESKSEAKKSEKRCRHLNKGVRLQAVENSLKDTIKGYCKDCRGKPKAHTDLCKEEELELALSVCICLKCGYQGCSRNALYQHAHSHFQKDSHHSLCINTTTLVVWCYACDKEIPDQGDNSQLQKITTLIYNKLKASPEDPGLPMHLSGAVKGLSNLGNTCFFNSVLQNISQTGVLVHKLDALFQMEEEIVIESEKMPKIELKVKKTSTIGPLTSALKCFLDDFHSSSRGIVAPNKLFGEITKKSPQFRGYRQQDSQELLRYLLDGMRMEEVKRIEAGVKEKVKSLDSSPTKEQIRECVNNAKTFVDDVFGGSLASTIVCSQCNTKSQVYDAFLDLSLPVNLISKESAKSASLKILNSMAGNENKSGSEDEKPKGKKMSKHQKKQKLKKEKKAKRSKNRTSLSQKGSKEGSIVAEKADGNCDKGEKKDDKDGHDGRDDSNEAPDGPREDEDSRSTAIASENENNASCTKFDVEEKYSVTDAEEFVIIDRISGDGGNSSLPPNQGILGGGALKSQSSTKSSLESLVSGETGSLASTRCISSREDVSFDETHSKRLNHLHVEDRATSSDGNFAMKPCPNSSVQLEGTTSATEDANSEEDSVSTKGISALIDSFSTSLQLNGEVKNEEERSTEAETNREKVHESTDEKEKNRLNGRNEDVELKMKQQMEDELIQNVNAGSVLGQNVTEKLGKEDMLVTSGEESKDATQKDSNSIEMENPSVEEQTSVVQERADVVHETKQLEVQQVPEEDNQVKRDSGVPTVAAIDLHNAAIKEVPKEGSEKEMMGISEEVNIKNSEEATQELQGEVEDTVQNNDASTNTEQTESDDTGEDCADIESEEENVDDDIETVGPEYVCNPGECSIMSCLRQFTNKDVLEGNNKFRCEECTKRRKGASEEEKVKPVYTEATKQMQLWMPPRVLTLHLKRFEQVGRGLRKVNKHIEFPLELDLSPFCLKNDMVSHESLQYSLSGIVEHSGSLHGGHYVAYVKTMTPKNKSKWYYISDSHVSEIKEEAVLRKQAYILFYHQKK